MQFYIERLDVTFRMFQTEFVHIDTLCVLQFFIQHEAVNQQAYACSCCGVRRIADISD